MRDFTGAPHGDDTTGEMTGSENGIERGSSAASLPPTPHSNAIPPDLAFLFDAGETPWAPLPTIVARPNVPLTTETIELESDFTLAANAALLASNGPTRLLRSWNSPDILNDGVIWIQSTTTETRAIAESYWGTITNNGDIISLSKTGNAFGYMDSARGVVANNGNIVAISSHANVIAFGTYQGASSGAVHTNSGLIEAWAGQRASGAWFANSSAFENSGTIRAQGLSGATGVEFQRDGDLTNSGLIEAASDEGTAIGVHLYWQGDSVIDNSGTIRAATAIYASYQYDDTIEINNGASGRVEGDVTLWGSVDAVTNNGVITGNVSLGEHDDVYTQTTGQLDGWLDLGSGNDIANTDTGNQIIFGGDGNDTIHAGAGSDIIGGGRGADLLDGGSGRDTADYSGSSLGIAVDLLAGTASGGDASGDTLISIENVQGSAWSDRLGGDGGNNTLTGLAGNDVLTGRGGNDILDGGLGDDTAVYSGNSTDYSIVTNSNGSRTIADLRAGSPDGVDTLTGIEILQFANTTIGGPASPEPPDILIRDILFDAGSTPWAPLPTAILSRPDAGLVADVIGVLQDYTLLLGEAAIASGGPVALFNGNGNPDFTNDGLAWIENHTDWAVAFAGTYWGTITNNGDIVALSRGGPAYGINSSSSGVLQNFGNVLAISVQGSATGYSTYDGSGLIAGTPHLNSGLIEAWSGTSASGVKLNNGGRFDNSGTIRAQGQSAATALLVQDDTHLTNSGLIEAISSGSRSIGVHLYWHGNSDIDNTGTIRADTALYADYQYARAITINNAASGRIEGNIDLTGSVDTITNDGVITGNVSLGELDDVFTQTTGQLDGRLDLGGGDDIANTDTGSQTIFGGDGNDTIHAGADKDSIGGGRGADILDGGDGRDTADYGRSALGVAVDLLAGTASGGDASSDTLISIEDLRGSAYADSLGGDNSNNTLNGLDGNDVLTGYGGNDTLNGGAGNDMAIYRGNMADYSIVTNTNGSQTVTDLRAGRPDGVDTLTGIEVLQFADGSIGDPISAQPPVVSIFDFLFDPGEVLWAPLPTAIQSRPVGGLVAETINTLANYTLMAGEAVIASNGPATLFSSYDQPYLISGGLIWIENDTQSSTAIFGGNWQAVINTGDIVALSGTGLARGYYAGSWGVLNNHGNLLAISGEGDAIAYSTYSTRSFNGLESNLNTGLIEAWAGGTATGMYLYNGGPFDNSGTIRAQGSVAATGLRSYHAATLTNSGLIEAFSGNGDGIGIHLYYSGESTIDNSGTIRATTAIYADYRTDQIITINNTATGLIEGDIDLSGSVDIITNDGVIIGNVSLGSQDDVFTQTSGRLEGMLDLGSGDDIANTGLGSQHILGGSGDDEIHAGADDDILVGNTGADVLDGGEGQDETGYADSNAGVSIDLQAGTATGGDAEGDTLISIENLNGSNFADILTGDSNANSLRGNGGDDTLEGGGGDDLLAGGSGADSLDGGDGADFADYRTSSAGVSIDLGLGTASGGDADGDTLIAIESLHGSQFDDTLSGDAGANTLIGHGGADALDGRGGIDLADYADSAAGVTVDLAAGTGLGGDAEGDTLLDIENLDGSGHDDSLTGDSGANILRGNAGDDQLYGNDGHDTLIGGAGADLMNGGAGIDLADYSGSALGVQIGLGGAAGSGGDAAGDTLVDIENLLGSSFDDMLTGDAGANTLTGAAGNDRLYGDAGADLLEGGLGDDWLYGGDDSDRLEGGAGDDQIFGEHGHDIAHGGDGNDRILGGIGRDTLYGDDGDDILSGGDGADRLFGGTGDDDLDGGADDDLIVGNEGHDIAHGGDGNDRILGGAGRDNLYGDAGHDVLIGEDGADRMFGGDGNDDLDGGAGGDLIAGNDGHDVLHGGDGNDRLLGGAGRDNLYGDADDDGLSGGDGADRIFGGDGDDDLDGGADDDLIAGNDGHDIAHGGDGNDRMLGGAGRDSLYGDAGHDTLIGGAGGDRMFGGLGNDDLDGGDGFDQLVGNEGHDTIHGGAGNDRLFGNDGRDTLYGDGDDDKLYGGNGADRLYGGDGRDQLDGGDANDFLFGDLGNDRLTGGLGDDRIDGGDGNDTAIFSGNYADYTVVISGSSATVTGADGVDTLTGIEFMQFDDQRVRLWLDPVSSSAPDGFDKPDTPVMDVVTLDDARPDDQNGLGESAIATAERPVTDSIDWGTRVTGSAFTVYFALAGESFGGETAGADWTDAEKAAAMAAWGVYSDVANISFTQTANQAGATFTLVKADLGTETLGYFNPPGETDAGLGFFNYLDSSWTTAKLQPGGIGFVTLVHEFGHGLGLAHPHDDGGTSSIMSGVTGPYDSYGDFGLNQGVFTMMSYNDGWPTGPNGVNLNSLGSGWPGTAGTLDIAVIQSKYGINPDHNDGDTIYYMPWAGAQGDMYQAIWDTGGIDTIVHGGNNPAVIDLRPATLLNAEGGGGYVTYSDGVMGGFTIANGVVIENARGGSGNDTIIGNSADNTFTGETGDDLLDGGDGIDTAIYTGFDTDYRITDNGDGSRTIRDLREDSPDGTDTLISIEVLQFASRTGITVIGDEADNYIHGTDVNDYLDGAGGDDTLVGLSGDDVLLGGRGDDSLRGGAGADALDGGAGQDLVDYRDSPQAVLIDLASGTGSGGDAEGDTLTGIEIVLGSRQADTLIGDAGNNTLSGWHGSDSLYGGDGDDILIGGITGDTLDGGNGRDLADYQASTAAVWVDLAQGTGSGGDADHDRLTGIEDLLGSAYDDTLIGDAGNNTLSGLTGDDRLFGGDGDDTLVGGAGADRLVGGADIDLADYSGSDLAIAVNLRTGTASGGDAAGDALFSIESVTGTQFDDTLIGDAAANTLSGGAGSDRLSGDAGEDLLRGGLESDTLYGGDDADRLYGDEGDDQIFGQHGHDIAHGGDGDDRILGDIGRDSLYGDAGDDELSGGDGADRLFGGTGNDDLDGGDGNDLIAGNDGHDIAHGGDGNDRMLGGAGRDNLYGEAGHDTLIGEDGGDRMFGGLGNDDLDGGAGFDQLVGNEGHDTIHGGDGRDRLFGNDGRDTLYGDGDDDKLYGGDGADQLHGGDGRDQLDGGDANDFLFGDLGNDRLTGGLGDDRIDGGDGNDTAIFSGNYADYTVVISGSSATVTGADGVDTLTGIEFMQFDDQRVRLWLDPVSSSAPADLTGAMDTPDGFGKPVTPGDAAPHLPVLELLNHDGVGRLADGLAVLADLIDPPHALIPPDRSHSTALIRLTEDGPNPHVRADDTTITLHDFDPGLPFELAAPEMIGIDAIEGWH